MEESTNFQINGTELLLKDLNVFVTTKVNFKDIMERMRQLALSNNTTGASIYDLGNLIKAESIAEITSVLKGVEQKVEKQRAQEQEHQAQMQEQMIAAQQEQLQAEQAYLAEQNELDRQNNIDVAELKGAGFQVGDMNNNGQTDYIDSLQYLSKERQNNEQLSFKREQEMNKNNIADRTLSLKQQELATRKEIAEKQVQIARTNKNKYDVKGKK